MKNKLVVVLVAMFTILASVAIVHAGLSCGASEIGCVGSCPPEVPWCVNVAQGPGWVCECRSTLWLFIDGCLGFLENQVTFSAVLSDATGGASWLTPGNTLTLRQETAADVRVEHDDNWGGGTQTVHVPAGTVSVSIHFTEYEADNPTRLKFEVSSLGAVLPSFASVALDGDQTGDNVFSLDPGESRGWIDTETGELYVKLYVKFFNDVFVDAPARLQASFWGHYDQVQGRFYVDPNDAGEEDAVAESPDEDVW